MSTNPDTLRRRLHELADQLPADATWDDVIEEARFRRAVEAGLAAADRGAFAVYRRKGEFIEILRVWHAKRNWKDAPAS
ncbi:MAG: hypothetical protein ACREXS_11250 [Gammaproteobacteria bacterium]